MSILIGRSSVHSHLPSSFIQSTWHLPKRCCARAQSTSGKTVLKTPDGKQPSDPRIKKERSSDHDYRVIVDDYAALRDTYEAPKNPIILAHGLFGFDELRIAGPALPGLHYWRGITEALAAKGVEVITATVPPSGSIEKRAERLGEVIKLKAQGKSVNIVAGLDSRYMISQLRPSGVKVLSLTTIATPHRGSAFADYIFDRIGPMQLPKVYKLLEFFGFETGAFSQLTRSYMSETFNPKTPDVDDVRLMWSISYYSYGATFRPHWSSVFRQSHGVVTRVEGPNDGLVSAESSRWGEYQGTLDGVSHLDLINWTNRLRWWIWELTGGKHNFNAIAFYLSIADMLAKKGL